MNSIRLRTGYSFRSAVGTLEEYSELLQPGGWAPITDRASSYGWIRWIKLCKEKNLKPVIGVELAVSPDMTAKRPIGDYWIFYSTTNSLEPINNLVTLAMKNFRYQPLLSYDIINDLGDGVICIMGHKANVDLLKLKSTLYAPLSPALAPGQTRRFRELGLPWAAAGDNFYPTSDDVGRYQVICGRLASTQTYPQHFLSEEEWRKYLSIKLQSVFGGQIENTLDQALENSECILSIASKAHPILGKLPHPQAVETLDSLCLQGAKKKGLVPLTEEYQQRLNKELRLIEEKDFGDYFHIVSDITRWSRDRLLVGPARGSAAGSLVCFLLGITAIDPLQHGLIFERFIDINRPDLPDIDIDFSDAKRESVIDYIKSKYGSENVSRLGTVNVYKARSALREACGALRIPLWKMDTVLDSMIERSSGDARAMHTLEDTFEQMPAGRKLAKDHPEIRIVEQMEGHPRHSGRHASAVIVSDKPLVQLAPVSREGSLMVDKKDAEKLDLLKIDVLGLTQLSVLEDALRLSDLPLDTLDGLKLERPEAYKLMRSNKFSGIFQVQGIAVQGLARQIGEHMTEFNDLVALSALARPGPLASGNAEKWVKRRKGLEEVSYPHPIFEQYLKDTLGIVIYQEQVMEIGRKVGDLSWGKVTELRKSMSQSLGVEHFNQFGESWKVGARKKNIPEDILDKMWNDLCEYGSWGFNKSHAVSYGLITYWCLYMKANYPLAFSAATLNHAKDIEKQQEMLRELVKEGYSYLPVDSENSTENWTISKDQLIGPLQNIKGIGPKSVKAILESRRQVIGSQKITLPGGILKKLANPVTPLDELYPIGAAIKKMYPNGLQDRNILTEPTPVENIADPEWRPPQESVLVIGAVIKITRRDANEAVLIAKRGYIMKGQTQYLNMWIQDDTGKCFIKVTQRNFLRLGKPIVDRGRAGKAIYAFKGHFWNPGSFRMLMASQVRYLGDVELGREEDNSTNNHVD